MGRVSFMWLTVPDWADAFDHGRRLLTALESSPGQYLLRVHS